MTHQIPPHLAFCTPGQNQKAKQGTNPETLKRNKQTQKQLHIEILIPGDRCRTGCHDITLQNMQFMCVCMNRLNK